MVRRHTARLVATGLAVLAALSVIACGASSAVDADQAADGGTVTGEQGTFGALPSAGGDSAASSELDKHGQACSTAGETQRCFVGDPAKAGVGSCTWGSQTCAASGEFLQWGACTGSGAPTPAACDGTDHLCNGQPDASCKCTPKSTIACYTGPQGTRNVGQCRAGVQVCNDAGDGYGPCIGEVTPRAETCGDKLDHSCNGAAGCADSQCTNNPACRNDPGGGEVRQTYCKAAGTVNVSGVRFRLTSLFPKGVCSGAGSSCSSLTTGGTFTANCAGNYRVCARVPTTQGCQVASNLCVSVSVPRDGMTVALPPIPGFGPASDGCVASCFNARGQIYAALDVAGQTSDGIAVDRRDVAPTINPTYCVVGGDNGGGGGGNF